MGSNFLGPYVSDLLVGEICNYTTMSLSKTYGYEKTQEEKNKIGKT
jgi:hypothetical protein